MDTTMGAVRERAETEGQGHVFRFWDELDAAGRARLGAEVAALDWETVSRLRALLERPSEAQASASFAPPELFTLERDAADSARAAEARAAGARELATGRVGYVLVAGGQGSRLGFDGPKGRLPVGPVSGASLFAWHAARLAAARERHGAPVRWYVMTSASNDAATRAEFRRNDDFGLGAGAVRFFQQAMLPALDREGRILLAARDRLFLAPNGHGGTLAALATSGCLAHARAEGVETLSYFQVDNPLARPADTLFLGLHALAGADMSSKVVQKRDAREKVGVIGRADGRLGCIEYSDLPDRLRDARGPDGRLLFGAGNIAAHALRRGFVEQLTARGLDLPWHLARKRMQVVGDDGAPTEVEGVKFETFVFDALGAASASVTLEVERAEEFSPVKNATGEDSPASCRRDLTVLFAGWLRAAGEPVPAAGADGCPPLEVDPRFAEDPAGFAARLPAAPATIEGGVLYR
jgi:UDP-N-acetylglucosamine/UDP-N-acetylgalactosamine diphosphorylase